MSSESSLLSAAVAAYPDAQYRTDTPADASERAAHRFRTIIDELDQMRSAVPLFTAALSDEDHVRRYAAARVLVESHWPEAIDSLLQAYATQGPFLKDRVLRKLGRHAPLPDVAWDLMERVRPFEQGALVQALLTWPTPAAEQRWHELVKGNFDAHLVEQGIIAVASWKRPELLRALLAEPRRPIPVGLKSMPADLKPGDFRLQAAFRLALDGDQPAIEFLFGEAAHGEGRHAVDACVHLAHLGLPSAIPLLERHLRGRSNYAVEFAMCSAGCLGSPLLGPALCAVAEQPKARGVPSIPDQSLRVLASITGNHSAPPMGDDGSATPHALRIRATIVQRTALAELDPDLRYADGHPLTLGKLVTDLTSPHQGPVMEAAFALRAITGDDFGFDPEDDLIGNLDALNAWRARASQPSPVGPGEWAFRGKKLPPPTSAT